MTIRSGFRQRKKKRWLPKKIRLPKFQFKKIQLRNVKVLSRFLKKGRRSSKQYLRRDIHRKDFRNPNKKGKRIVKGLGQTVQAYRDRLGLTLLGVVIFAWLYALFGTPYFYLKTIDVEGNKEIEETALQQIVQEHFDKRSWLLVKRSHRFFLRPNKLDGEIRARYGLDELSFDSHWPSRTLSVNLKEKTSVLAYSVHNKYYTIDRKGVVVRVIEDFQNLDAEQNIPVIYHYSSEDNVEIASEVLPESTIEAILSLHTELAKYTAFTVHSFRLKESRQRSIAFEEKLPELEPVNPEDLVTEKENQLEAAVDSIAQARSLDEKVEVLRSTLDGINLEKLEEERVEQLLKEEKRFEPNPDYTLDELEIYMDDGWSIKLGHQVLEDPSLVENQLQYFATLSGQVNVGEEVSEYIDLRFPGRIYYR